MSFRFSLILQQFSAVLLALTLGACVAGPPVQEMSDARQAILAANNVDAQELAADELKIAEDLLHRAESYIRVKEFTSARREAIASRAKAVEARSIAERKASAGPEGRL